MSTLHNVYVTESYQVVTKKSGESGEARHEARGTH